MSEKSLSKQHEKEEIYGPIVWRRLSLGLRIQELLQDNFKEATDFILKYYVGEDIIFRNTRLLEDPDSLQSFKNRLYHIMNQCHSIVAINEINDDMVGALLISTVKKDEYGITFDDLEIGTGKVYQSIMAFINNVNRYVDVFDQFKCDEYLRMFLICVKPSFRNHRVAYNMLSVGFEVARYLEIDVIMSHASSFMLQNIYKKLGMKILHACDYRNWHDPNGELVFNDTGSGNQTCAIMAYCWVPPEKESITEKEHMEVAKKSQKKKKEHK